MFLKRPSHFVICAYQKGASCVSHLARSFQTLETRLSRGKSKLRGSAGPEWINLYASKRMALRKEENLFQEQFSSFPLIFLPLPFTRNLRAYDIGLRKLATTTITYTRVSSQVNSNFQPNDSIGTSQIAFDLRIASEDRVSREQLVIRFTVKQ